MNDMRSVIVPKSDQINADDLLSGPMTIIITDVIIRPGTEQPVSIHFDGDGGKPFKPCKSMARVMVHCWGPDANQYKGRRMTLYCDPKVKWGGMEVGGIRISHMSHIPATQVMALTVTKGSRKPFTVQPLASAIDAPKKRTIAEWLNDLEAELSQAQTTDEVDEIVTRQDVREAPTKLKNGALDRFNNMVQGAIDRTAPPENNAPNDEIEEAAE